VTSCNEERFRNEPLTLVAEKALAGRAFVSSALFDFSRRALFLHQVSELCPAQAVFIDMVSRWDPLNVAFADQDRP